MKRLVSILALTALASLPASAQYFGKNKVRYDAFQWKVYPTPHFRISYYDRVEPSLPKLASFAESAYDELARKLNFQITSEPIPIIAYATHAEFEQTNTLVEFIPEGVGAFALPSRNRMVLPVDLTDRGLQELIQHELTHVFQFEILFQGRLGKALTSSPPQWFMEGMASYFADDEDARARSIMRDAALADRVASVAEGPQGYDAYRYGHMVFKFVESEWGMEGVRDLVFEFRNSLSGSVGKAVKRAFDLDIEEFDSRFRSWMRKYYQPFGERGDPREFGQLFRIQTESRMETYETSPVASPSGDLIAAFTTFKEDVDVVLFGVPDRKLFRNLTSGNTTRYMYLIAQMLTVGPDRGRDLAFSPDGDLIAVFARRERSRDLLLLDSTRGRIRRRFPISVDQAMEPAFSPDGKTIAFHAFAGGRADIYRLDLESGKITNLTQDEAYDGDPVFTADGKHLVFSSQTGDYSKLFELDLENPTQRRQLTFGAGDDEGTSFSRDGKRLYFASDRDQGVMDIYALDLETRELTRLTKVIGAALNPVAIPTRDGERVVFQGYAKGRWSLYVTDPAQGKPAGKEEVVKEAPARERYEPAISVAINKEKAEPVKRHKLGIDDMQVLVGINNDNTLLSETYISLADNYGDRRFNLLLSSVQGYTTFSASYLNLAKRLQWGLTVFDDRSYYVYRANPVEDRVVQQQAVRQTGAAAFAQYPFSIYHRVEATVGYISQSISYPMFTDQGTRFASISNNIPWVGVSLTGDTTFWQYYGPHGGRRMQLSVNNSIDTQNGGSLSRDYILDARQYLPISRRNELALRLYAAWADGNQPNLYYFGGIDTLRGYDYRTLVGNRAAYLNAEWRFPLIDHLVLPWLHLTSVRGRFFIDVGGTSFDLPAYTVKFGGEKIRVPGYKQGFQFMKDGRLKDAVSSYGFGLSLDLFGLPAHWDFAKRWDFKDSIDKGYRTEFWIGMRY
ncbi:MAG TPA: BamA/TamA family outer membrane protein [Thermoanaerobaculaceae bacterium]|nr:BamA/TamA family outer membrane protein [Thermoanaerobaculaceae bacterium]HPS77616.1 BamA/TamA family outer membrane protein [Thermoanaerobaculaceae bacterium]